MAKISNISMSGNLRVAASSAPPPPPPPPPPPFTAYTSMLLNGTGTNNATNNVFVDSSTNNFTITRVGSTTQGSSSPFSTQSGYWSNYFDGNGDTVVAPAGAAFAYGTGAFTIEAWVNTSAYNSGPYDFEVVFCQTVIFRNYLMAGITIDGYPRFVYGNGGGTTVTGDTKVPLNTWTHLAWVREGTGSNQFKIYMNGVVVATSTVDFDFNDTSYNPTIGDYTHGPALPFKGYISNLRVVKGTAVYTNTFTPSTTPLTAVNGTSLLTCQSNRFIDNSTNNFTITRNGNTSVSAFGPFVPASSYNASTMGGSLYFDGNGDYLTAPNNSAFTLGASGNFTIECWVYPRVTPSGNTILVTSYTDFNAFPGYNAKWCLMLNGTTIRWYSSAGNVGIDSSSAVSVGAWSHIAVVRNGGTITMYLNGTSVGTQTDEQSYTAESSLSVGYVGGGGNYFNGFMSGLRIVKGAAVYTANFTPPTAAPTAISGTSVLLNGTNGAIIDTTSRNDIKTLGDAKISTTVSANGSIYLDGNGDYLTAPSSDLYAFGTGDFTVECWVRFNATSGYQVLAMLGSGLDGAPAAYNAWAFYLGDGNLNFNRYSPTFAGTVTPWSPSTGQWYHVAVSRSGSDLKFFVNGTQLGSTFTNSTNYAVVNSDPLTIGRFQANAGNIYSSDFYMNDLRITKGQARYTANFTPPVRS